VPARPIQSIGRALVAAVWPAVLSAILLLAGARWLMPERIEGPVAEAGWTRRSRAAFAPSGFHPPELDPASGQSFTWSRERSELTIEGLRRTRAYHVTLAVRGIRPPGAPPAELRVLVDGQLRLSGPVPADRSDVTFEIPRRDQGGATITLEVPVQFVPGGADPRALGVIVDRVGIGPVNGPWVPRGHAIAMLAISVFLVGLAVRLCGISGWLGTAVSIGIAVAYAWLVLKDAAFLGGYVDRLLTVSGIALALGAIVGGIRLRWSTLAGAPEWSVGAALVIAGSAFKLAVFWHPLAIVGDGIFQVHRAAVVHGGEFFFTSITPKPFFEFPYPVALYVFALPFWSWFPAELDQLRLLRTVAIVADAVAGVMLYGAVRRQWSSRTAALLTAALWPFATAPLQALSNANLTNVFGQSMFAAAVGTIAWVAAGSSMSVAGLALAGLFLTVAFLSHFGTVTVGLAVMGIVVAALVVLGERQTRRVGVATVVALVAVASMAWFLYYSHPKFRAVYGKTAAAVSGPASDDSSKMVASPAVKLERWWSGSGDDYGRPGLVVLFASLAGAAILIRQQRTGAGLVFLAWIVAWAGVTSLGILTPLTLRANLAAAPAFIVLASVAIGSLAAKPRAGAIAATVVAALVAWDGLRVITACLRLT